MSRSDSVQLRRPFVLLALPLLCAAVALSACTGGSAKASSQGTAESGAGAGTSAAPGSGQGAQRQFPGATGEIAAIDGTTLQVQNTQSQTAVVYTAKTAITNTVAATRGDVKVGLCASARPARPTETPSGGVTETPSGGAADGSGTDQTGVSSVTAVTVVLTQPVNGECAGGFAGFGGAGRFGGLTGARPSGAPSGQFGGVRPSEGPSGTAGSGNARRGAFGATGKITAVNGASFVVASVRFARGQDGASASASPTPTTTDVTVTTTSGTTYTKTVVATATALKVGRCVTALGKQDETGTIQATAIAVRPKDNGTCAFGGPNG